LTALGRRLLGVED